MVHSIMVVTVDPGKIEQIVAAATTLAESTRREPGCLSYNLLQPRDSKNTVIFLEMWETFENFLAHVALGETEGTPLNQFGKVMMPATIGEPQHWLSNTLV
jgi:quinol monooxygenase YgiN